MVHDLFQICINFKFIHKKLKKIIQTQKSNQRSFIKSKIRDDINGILNRRIRRLVTEKSFIFIGIPIV